MRSGSTKRARYAFQFFAVPAGGSMMSRATVGTKRACASLSSTQLASSSLRSASSRAKRITSSRWP